MRLQEYRIHLINGRMIHAAEEVSIPHDKRLHNRYMNAKIDEVLTVGSEETARAFVPVRNILYISTGETFQW